MNSTFRLSVAVSVVGAMLALAGCAKKEAAEASKENESPPVAETPVVPSDQSESGSPAVEALLSFKNQQFVVADFTSKTDPWDDIKGKPARVQEAGCTGLPPKDGHCHYETKGQEPERLLTVAKEGDTYRLMIVTPADSHESLDCPGLKPGANPALLVGECTVSHAQGAIKHTFRVWIVKHPKDPSKRRVWWISHENPADAADPDVHNGHGHADGG